MRHAAARTLALLALAASTEEFARHLREDIEKWARIVKVSGAKQDR